MVSFSIKSHIEAEGAPGGHGGADVAVQVLAFSQLWMVVVSKAKEKQKPNFVLFEKCKQYSYYSAIMFKTMFLQPLLTRQVSRTVFFNFP